MITSAGDSNSSAGLAYLGPIGHARLQPARFDQDASG